MLSFLRRPELQTPLAAPHLLDRDHSILAFNERVLSWAARNDVPLLERLRWAREMVEDVYGAPVYGRKGYEADDLIAALTRNAIEDGLRVVILALDKDLTQLVNNSCVMWDGKKSITGPTEVWAKFGVRPDQMRDYLAICGDAADNIPGVKGMGPEAAKEVLAEFHTLEYALDVATKLPAGGHPYFKRKPRHRELLREQKAQAELSMKLVSLAYDAPLPYDLQEMKRWSPKA